MPDLSVGDPNNAKITNVNVAYLGVLEQAKSDLLLTVSPKKFGFSFD